jgi:hypothetical protein
VRLVGRVVHVDVTRIHTNVGQKTWKVTDGMVMLKTIKKIGCDVVDWIQLVWDRVQWWAFVNTFVFRKRWIIFCPAKRL